MTGRFLSPKQVSERLQIPLGTVYDWRTSGRGPRGFRAGKHVRYQESDVDAWVAEQLALERPIPTAS